MMSVVSLRRAAAQFDRRESTFAQSVTIAAPLCRLGLGNFALAAYRACNGIGGARKMLAMHTASPSRRTSLGTVLQLAFLDQKEYEGASADVRQCLLRRDVGDPVSHV